MVYKLPYTLLLHAYLLKTSGDYINPTRPVKKIHSQKYNEVGHI